jgi:Acyl-CoA synthetases (AMP-forming)/AMP-acid ligases II
MNLATLAEQSLERLGERITLDFEGQKITNVASHERSLRLHRAFSELGMKRGEIAVMCMVSHPSVYDVFQGIFRSGGTAVPVMFIVTDKELRFVLEDTRARGVVTDAFNLGKVREAVKGLDFVQWIAVQGGQDKPRATPREHALETLLTAAPQTELPPIDPKDDVALMLYTSGTMGWPKGVMLTHANLIAAAQAALDATELHLWEGPRISVSAMPMAHIFGVSVMTSGYLTPKEIDGYLVQIRWFDPEAILRLIQEHRCTVMPAVPTMLAMILNHPEVDKYDLSSLREVVCAAAPLPVDLAEGFMRKFGCRILEVYGMTENAGMATANRRSEPFRPGSAGRPYVNIELRIVDDHDNELPRGQRGEIVTRGPTVMKGYFNRPEATAETLPGSWLHTGDIGYLDEDGYLYIVDRKKDVIIKGGRTSTPQSSKVSFTRTRGSPRRRSWGYPTRSTARASSPSLC